jgi:hypothetical protein
LVGTKLLHNEIYIEMGIRLAYIIQFVFFGTN